MNETVQISINTPMCKHPKRRSTNKSKMHESMKESGRERQHRYPPQRASQASAGESAAARAQRGRWSPRGTPSRGPRCRRRPSPGPPAAPTRRSRPYFLFGVPPRLGTDKNALSFPALAGRISGHLKQGHPMFLKFLELHGINN